jgi:hypothetical protein
MKLGVLLLVVAVGGAQAQDSSFSSLTLRVSALRNPVAGHIDDDWESGTGGQLELATNIGRSQLGLSLGHLGYTSASGKPAFTGTLFTLAWMSTPATLSRMDLRMGARLTDLRMDFDDPSLVGGLRTEEEVLVGAIARARASVGMGFSGFVEASYGVLMLSTRTPMVLLSAGIERTAGMPGFLRRILR